MKHSLIIPAYNEAPVLKQTLLDLRAAFEKKFGVSDWEIIVVDNASTDGTRESASSLADSRIRTIMLPEKGKGRAIRAGFSEAKGEIVGFTDADLSVPPEEVADAFLALPQTGGILIGSRFHPESRMPGREWWRTLSSELFNFYARFMLGIPFLDTQCPLKVVDQTGRELMLSTREDTWFFDLEFLSHAHRARFPVREVPVTWNEHRYPERKSKLSTSRDGLRYLFAMPRIRRRLAKHSTLGSGPSSLLKSADNNRVESMKWIIAGLANPEPEYKHTRHNIGRAAVDALREAQDLPDWEYKKSYDALISKGEIDSKEVLLILPQTYMNESGRSLVTLVKDPKQAEHLIVIADEIDLPLGAWKISWDRGSGGHNGVKSVIASLKTQAFVRIRIGVSPVDAEGHILKPKGEEEVLACVLGKFTPSEREVMDRVIGEVKDALPTLLREGRERAMDRYN